MGAPGRSGSTRPGDGAGQPASDPLAEAAAQTDDDPQDDFDDGELDEEEANRLAEAASEMAEVRRQLAAVPAERVVANHIMGLYELGAIHLSQAPPNFTEASLAIDAMGELIEGLTGRLGEAEATLRDALAQIRLAFVQLKAAG